MIVMNGRSYGQRRSGAELVPIAGSGLDSVAEDR